jgi:hypothetical protein
MIEYPYEDFAAYLLIAICIYWLIKQTKRKR